MHGAADDFILPEHSRQVYETTSGYTEEHYFTGAGHAESAIVCTEEYGEVLETFLHTIHYLGE